MDRAISRSPLATAIAGYHTRVAFYTYWVGRRQQAIKDGVDEPFLQTIHEDFCKTMAIPESLFDYYCARRAVKKMSELYEDGA